MLSRVANSIYWMCRYVERAENYARFMGVNFSLVLDLPPSEHTQWQPLLVASGDHALFQEHYEEPTGPAVLRFMSFDRNNPNAILNCLHKARENARSIREIISKEMWEHLNHFYLETKAASARQSWKMDDWQDFFNMVKMSSQLFFGIIDATITRGEGYHFLRLGRYLERADKTSRFLDVKYFILLPASGTIGSNLDLLHWTAVLKSVSAYNMYRQAFRSINPSDIVSFLVLDRLFPRSIFFCLREAEDALLRIAGKMDIANPAVKALGKLRADLEYTEVNDIFTFGLHEFLDEFQQRNNEVGDAIFSAYFALKPVIEGPDEYADQ